MDVDIDELIVQVRLRPELYDSACPQYRDRSRKRALWKEVCDALNPALETWDVNEKNVFGHEVQKKWNSLRDCFRRELNHQLKAPPEAKKKTKYRYYDRLLFLAPFSHISSDQAYAGPVRLLTQSAGNEAEFNEERVSNTVDTPEDPPSKRFKSSGVDRVIAELNETNRVMKEMVQNRVMDDDEAFLMSLRPSFKNCSMEEKFALRIELMQTIVRFKQSHQEVDTVSLHVKSENGDDEENPLGD